ncbi:MAG: TMEM175 family protein, partial [Chloroflexota bacterium]|nr:TMEM175 family protein [Chloroflexota bacterium]
MLDLRPPEGEPGGLFAGLVAQWPVYLAYVTSYFYVAVVWL